MTKEEYFDRKDELGKQYKLIDDEMDKIGFGEYNDGSGDFGTRRLYKEGDRLVFEIMIMDMCQEYWTNEYPDNQFYGLKHRHNNDFTSVEIKSVKDLHTFLSDGENYSFVLNKPWKT